LTHRRRPLSLAAWHCGVNDGGDLASDDLKGASVGS
jgi:hypothetical protein